MLAGGHAIRAGLAGTRRRIDDPPGSVADQIALVSTSRWVYKHCYFDRRAVVYSFENTQASGIGHNGVNHI